MKLRIVAAVLLLAAVGCANVKDTGLPASPTPTPPSKTSVDIVDSAFSPQELTVKVGEKVTWNVTGAAPHSATSVTTLFALPSKCAPSGTDCSKTGDTFEFTFTKAGTYPYYCVVHGSKAGALASPQSGMVGKIIVQ